jgi:hypothetical protein
MSSEGPESSVAAVSAKAIQVKLVLLGNKAVVNNEKKKKKKR